MKLYNAHYFPAKLSGTCCVDPILNPVQHTFHGICYFSVLWDCFLKWRGLVRLRAELSCLNLDSAPLLMEIQLCYSLRPIPVPAGSSAEDLGLVINSYKGNPLE